MLLTQSSVHNVKCSQTEKHAPFQAEEETPSLGGGGGETTGARAGRMVGGDG